MIAGDAPGAPPLGDDALHLWIARDDAIVEPTLLDRYRGWLTAQESERMARFMFHKNRHQYLITRALLRATLSLYAPSLAPARWTFASNEWGKPSIIAPPSPLAFNLSHTDGMVVLAVTAGSEVGVDVEHSDRTVSVDIADRFFSPLEVADLLALSADARQQGFFDLWTLKEAYIKACGKGLSIPLDSFSFRFPRPGQIDFARDARRAEDTEDWHFRQAKVGQHALALCCRRPRAELDIRIFQSVPGHSATPLALSFHRRSASE
ncbi:MAG: 4'-phosphopantetheinyl transferase superfamily protein [Pseudomonadota bacterium]